MTSLVLRADWVVPMAGPPIHGGEVAVGDDGRIVSVRPSDHATVRPADGLVLLPGLVNAHTHLELTGFDGLVGDAAFADWIPHIIRLKAARSTEEFLAAAKQGIRDGWAMGVTTVADCGDSGAVIEALAELGASGIAYHEVFGPHPDDADNQLAAWVARMGELRRFAIGRVRLGASPHAPYTVSGTLYRKAAAWARKEGLPLAVHVAEAADECALLRDGTGGFAEAWRRRKVPLPDAGCSPVAWLDRHEVFGPDTIAIHTIHVDDADIATLARRGCGVAHCPRSNRRHGHGDAPLARLLAAIPRLGVGTDSVASVAPLDLLAEARAARALAVISAERALELVTIGAARAIGLDAEVGTLELGKWGDAVAIRIPAGTGADRLHEAVLASTPAGVVSTWLAGRLVHQTSSSKLQALSSKL
ncbi:MAG: amidohydrolase family protein [Gemmatimonadales bacterium]